MRQIDDVAAFEGQIGFLCVIASAGNDYLGAFVIC
jgi:hypothetical protein